MKEFRKYFTLGVLLTTPLVVATQVLAVGEGTQQACCGDPACYGVKSPSDCQYQCAHHCERGSPLYYYCVNYCELNP